MATDATDAPTNPVPPATQAAPVKPGWKTTEFYFALAAKLLGAAYAAGLIGDGSTLARFAGLAVVVLAFLGYSVNRAVVKAAAMLVLMVGLSHGAMACGPSTQEKAIATTLSATNTAAAAFEVYDAKKQQSIVSTAGNRGAAETQLATWRSEQVKVEQLFAGLYRAIATAATLKTDSSLSGMVQAALIVSQELTAIGAAP